MSDEQQAAAVPTIYGKLAGRFPASAHKTKPAGGRELTYVDGEMVVSRLNEALGYDGWSFEVTDVTVLEDEVCARGRLTVYTGERPVVREQAGGQIINRTRGIPAQPARPAQEADGDRPAIPAAEAKPAIKGSIVELNNDIKGAITDCLKKCATLIGVGLYLFDPDERREVEAEMKAEKRGGLLPNQPRATTSAANPGIQGSQTGRSANTPTASGATPTSSSTTATDVEKAAALTGAPPINQQARWSRLVTEAERVQLPTLGNVKAIDPKAVSEAQLKSYADRLEAKLYAVREAGAA